MWTTSNSVSAIISILTYLMENAFTFKTIISSSLGKRKSKGQYCENRAFYDNIYTIKTDILYISIQSLFTLDFLHLCYLQA